ncbi:MAG: glycosyltransferase family 9 protein [Desulfobaccales bacterium]
MAGKEELSLPSLTNILIWHQGALGDLLLAGPALAAISRHYPAASLIGVGNPRCWHLLAGTLPLAAFWDSGAALWSGLFQDQGALSPLLAARLDGIELALVFSPRLRPGFLARLVEAGVSQAFWMPSYPFNGNEHVSVLQARRLKELGLNVGLRPFRLKLAAEAEDDFGWMSQDRILALAPGSGQPAKNWPLSHYYEVARALAWEAEVKVVWLAGPAEEPLLPYIQGLAAAQGQEVWVNRPLEQVARLLAKTQVYLGGDSGLTHLAAAAGTRRVVALFGPTDPRVWAPLGDQVTVLTPPSKGGTTTALESLPADLVITEIRRFL